MCVTRQFNNIINADQWDFKSGGLTYICPKIAHYEKYFNDTKRNLTDRRRIFIRAAF
jgi:hypothetical protein